MTGFQREEVIGKRCKDFLQCGETEADKVALLSDALANRRAVVTLLTNLTSDGKKFKCLLGLKPILDDNGNYCYVIALHFDVTREPNVNSRQSLVTELLEMVPNTIMLDSNEHDTEKDKDNTSAGSKNSSSLKSWMSK